MGLLLECRSRQRGRFPRPTRLTLTCDGDHGLLPAPRWQEESDSWEAAKLARATAAGWSYTPERILCPDCKARRR